jgi:hypothetical protein
LERGGQEIFAGEREDGADLRAKRPRRDSFSAILLTAAGGDGEMLASAFKKGDSTKEIQHET